MHICGSTYENAFAAFGQWLIEGAFTVTIYAGGASILPPVGPAAGAMLGASIFLIKTVVDPVLDWIGLQIAQWISHESHETLTDVLRYTKLILTYTAAGIIVGSTVLECSGAYLLLVIGAVEVLKQCVIATNDLAQQRLFY